MVVGPAASEYLHKTCGEYREPAEVGEGTVKAFMDGLSTMVRPMPGENVANSMNMIESTVSKNISENPTFGVVEITTGNLSSFTNLIPIADSEPW